MKKGKLLGKGLTAEVYEWGHSKVLKLYYSWISNDWIEHEYKVGCIVHEAGISSPALFGNVDVDGRKGIIFEQIYGRSIRSHVETEPWNVDYFGRRMAELHFKIHKQSAKELPSQNEKFTSAITEYSGISAKNQKKLLDYLRALPAKPNICHGDLHPNNIIVSGNSLVAVDWSGAYTGNPFGDVARTYLNIISPSTSSGAEIVMPAPYLLGKRLTCQAYLNEYMRLANTGFEAIDAWILPVAAARLREKIPGERKWLKDIVNKRLSVMNYK